MDATPAADHTIPSFGEATALRPLNEGRFAAELSLAWCYEGAANGGYLLALVARAALAATGRAHVHVVSGSFVRAAHPGAAEVVIEQVRVGKQLGNVRAIVVQDSAVVLDALLVLGARPGAQPSWQKSPDAAPAPFGSCQTRARRPGLFPGLDIRYDPAAAPDPRHSTGEGCVRGWVSFRDGSAPDSLAVLLAADMMPPSVLNLGMRGWAPTVQMTVFLRAVPNPGPLAVSCSARYVADGWFDENADVYDSDGRLIAQARQLALTPAPR